MKNDVEESGSEGERREVGPRDTARDTQNYYETTLHPSLQAHVTRISKQLRYNGG